MTLFSIATEGKDALVSFCMEPSRPRDVSLSDVPRCIDNFNPYLADRYGQPAWEPSPATLARLQQFSSPGNVRQLAQMVERHDVFAGSEDDLPEQLFSGSEPAVGVGTLATPARERLLPALPPEAPRAHLRTVSPPTGDRRETRPSGEGNTAEPPTFNLREVRYRTVQAAMAATNNHFGQAAKLLGVAPNTLTKLVAEACPELSLKKTSKRAAIMPLPPQRQTCER
jgi:DNA-binding NtrC family response regulator